MPKPRTHNIPIGTVQCALLEVCVVTVTVMMVTMILPAVTSDLGVTNTAAGEPEGPDAEVTLEVRFCRTCSIYAGVDMGRGREGHQELK